MYIGCLDTSAGEGIADIEVRVPIAATAFRIGVRTPLGPGRRLVACATCEAVAVAVLYTLHVLCSGEACGQKGTGHSRSRRRDRAHGFSEWKSCSCRGLAIVPIPKNGSAGVTATSYTNTERGEWEALFGRWEQYRESPNRNAELKRASC